jgi:hypothetical protein
MRHRKELEVMTPESPRWNEFADALYDAQAWKACGGAKLPRARAVMRSMGGIDIRKSLAFFREHGGWCDCDLCDFVTNEPRKENTIEPVEA